MIVYNYLQNANEKGREEVARVWCECRNVCKYANKELEKKNHTLICNGLNKYE